MGPFFSGSHLGLQMSIHSHFSFLGSHVHKSLHRLRRAFSWLRAWAFRPATLFWGIMSLSLALLWILILIR